jgi:hypothetical protein
MITGNRSKTVKTLNILPSDFYICIIVFIWCTFSFKYFSTIWHISKGNEINYKIIFFICPVFLRYKTSVGQGWSSISCSFKYLALRYDFWLTLNIDCTVTKNWSMLINFCKKKLEHIDKHWGGGGGGQLPSLAGTIDLWYCAIFVQIVFQFYVQFALICTLLCCK